MAARSASATLARGVILAAESLGAPREIMLAALGQRWDDLASYDLRIATRDTAALWSAIEQWAQDPLISIKIARVIAVSHGAALFQYTVRSAPTIEDAWARLVPMLGLFFGQDFEPITRAVPAGWELGYRLPLFPEPAVPRSEEAIVACFVEQCRAAAPAFTPLALCFQHAANAPLAEWRREVGAPVEFDASFYGVRVSPQVYRAPIASRDKALASLIAALAKPIVAAPATAHGHADAVARVIRDLIEQREPVTVARIARDLHVSQRTLQRQLQAAHTSVRGELDRVRHDAAVALLRDERLTIGEISARLGFADASQFSRAMRRWTGAAPSELRSRGAP
jgi:AraC-like DNA-binding protein